MENETKFEIVDSIGVIGSEKGKVKELNRVSWYGKEVKYDLRQWTSDHKKALKGITLSLEELKELKTLIDNELEYLEG